MFNGNKYNIIEKSNNNIVTTSQKPGLGPLDHPLIIHTQKLAMYMKEAFQHLQKQIRLI